MGTDSFLSPEVNRDRLYKTYLTILMSYVSDDGFVGPGNLSLSQRRRLTHQFISALLACGVPKYAPVLQRSLTWLVNSKEKNETTPDEFYVVPDKIEAAIEMGEGEGDFCSTALQLLLKRKRGPVDYDIPRETPNPFFGLWVTKILMEHPRSEDFKAIIAESLEVFVSSYKTLRARDLSLLIYLFAWLWREDDDRKASLDDMVETLKGLCHEGLFEVPAEIEIRIKDLRKNGLTPDLVAGSEKELYWSLVSTCYIVSSLAFLCPQNEELKVKVGFSEGTLFRILFRGNYKLGDIFTSPYHQIMLTARSLIALAAYTGEDVARITLPILLQELVEYDKNRAIDEKDQERRRLQRVVREWLTIEWSDDDQERLGGGYSGATVVRVKPKLWIPADTAGNYYTTSLPNLESAIIKYGRKAELDRERFNFQSVPPEFRSMFASIPSKAYKEIVDDEVYEYLVIEDLMGFKTLQETLPLCTEEFRDYLSARLVEFLRLLYTMPINPLETTGMIRHLYITPMFRSLETIHKLKQRVSSLGVEDFAALEALQALIGVSQVLDDFPPTVMHGDLNIRNVLLHGRQVTESELRFRLIDMDKFSRCGDFAYDIGEIVIDNENVCQANGFATAMLAMGEHLSKSFEYYAQTRSDFGYPVRFDLAKARSLLKIAEIRSRFGLTSVGTDPVSDRNALQIMAQVESVLKDAYHLLEEARTKASARV